MADKKEIPGFSQGVRINAAGRTVKMVRPICPNSKMDMIRTPEGRWIPNPTPDPGRQNCQRMGGRWWEYCVKQGHNPYYSVREWDESRPRYDETGKLLETEVIHHREEYPNIAQVAAHIRLNSGRGPEYKMRYGGFKRLKDLGFEEVCQFRNCQKVARYTSNVGLYCSQDHASLVAADAQGEFLTQITDKEFDLGSEVGIRRKRAEGLQKAAMFADIKEIT